MTERYFCKRCRVEIYPAHYPEEPEYCIECADKVIDKQIMRTPNSRVRFSSQKNIMG